MTTSVLSFIVGTSRCSPRVLELARVAAIIAGLPRDTFLRSGSPHVQRCCSTGGPRSRRQAKGRAESPDENASMTPSRDIWRGSQCSANAASDGHRVILYIVYLLSSLLVSSHFVLPSHREGLHPMARQHSIER